MLAWINLLSFLLLQFFCWSPLLSLTLALPSRSVHPPEESWVHSEYSRPPSVLTPHVVVAADGKRQFVFHHLSCVNETSLQLTGDGMGSVFDDDSVRWVQLAGPPAEFNDVHDPRTSVNLGHGQYYEFVWVGAKIGGRRKVELFPILCVNDSAQASAPSCACGKPLNVVPLACAQDSPTKEHSLSPDAEVSPVTVLEPIQPAPTAEPPNPSQSQSSSNQSNNSNASSRIDRQSNECGDHKVVPISTSPLVEDPSKTGVLTDQTPTFGSETKLLAIMTGVIVLLLAPLLWWMRRPLPPPIQARPLDFTTVDDQMNDNGHTNENGLVLEQLQQRIALQADMIAEGERYLNHLKSALNSQYQESRQLRKEKNQALATCRATIDTGAKQIETLEAQIEEFKTSEQLFKRQVATLEQHVETLQSQKTRSELELETAQARISVLTNQLAELNDEKFLVRRLLTCPLTHEVMGDPVIAADGMTYERSAIEERLKCGCLESPLTGQPLPTDKLTPNYMVRQLARRKLLFQEQNSSHQDSPANTSSSSVNANELSPSSP